MANSGRTRLLRSPGPFRVLWCSRTISIAGDGIGRTALVLAVAGQGPGAVGLVLLASALPRFLGPVAGALADRVEQRRLLAVCELGQAATFAVIAATVPTLPALLGLVFVAGAFATALVPAGRSVIPDLVPAADLGRANGLLGVVGLPLLWPAIRPGRAEAT